MRILQLIAVLFCVLVSGCLHTMKPGRPAVVLLLDNSGGYSHAGRQIVLFADGSYLDSTYTDVVGDKHTKAGYYTLNPDRTHMVLSPDSGKAQDLFRVDYGGQEYWVQEADRERIKQPSESRLRQITVRVVQ